MNNRGDGLPAERVTLSPSHRHPLPAFLALLLAGSAAAGLPVYETASPSPEDLPDGVELVGALELDPTAALPPAAFSVAPDGSVQVLLPSPPRLVTLGSDDPPRPLTGEGFSPEEAGLVDLLARAKGRSLVLDSAAGTLWEVDGGGGVHGGRHGHFVSPTRVRRGPGGRILVADPGSESVVVLGPDLSVTAARRGPDLAPGMVGEDRLPFLDIRRDGSAVRVGLVPVQGSTPTSERLAVVEAAPGYEVMSAEVLGADFEAVHVLTAEAHAETGEPRYRLHRVPRGEGEPRSRELPALSSGCLDCGPTYRLGPDGEVYAYLLRRGLYRVVRILPGKDQG